MRQLYSLALLEQLAEEFENMKYETFVKHVPGLHHQPNLVGDVVRYAFKSKQGEDGDLGKIERHKAAIAARHLLWHVDVWNFKGYYILDAWKIPVQPQKERKPDVVAEPETIRSEHRQSAKDSKATYSTPSYRKEAARRMER